LFVLKVVDEPKKSAYAGAAAYPETFRTVILMRPLFLSFLFLLLLSSLLQEASGQAVVDNVYRVNVRLVDVDVQVAAKKTHQAIRNLAPGDFEIYEDNVRQQITSFSQDQLPLSIVFLFDLTDSVRPVLKSLAAGAMDSLGHLKPEDELAVMTYSASARLIQDFTTDHALAVAAMEKASRMESDEAAFFNEGIYQAASQLAKGHNPSSRRVVIWLTDDIPNFPSEEIRVRYGRSLGKAKLHSEAEATAALLHAGATVSTLLERSRMSDDEFSLRLSKAAETMRDSMRYPPGSVQKYALASGGEVIETSQKHMQEHLALLIDNLRSRYTLAYHASPQPKGKYSAIKVRLTPEAQKSAGHVTIASRQGYYH
jgi:VWFA-related protein